MRLSRIDGTTWTPIAKVSLTTPGDVPEVSFARFGAPGSLWVGLRYRDGKERRAYGVAIVEPSTGKVTYHRTELAVPDRKSKMLPIPIGVVDADVRGDTAWFATNEGIARLAGGQVKVWTEADGLRSELARAVTIAPDGSVMIASGQGAEVWDGKTWSFPAALQFEINDLVATRNGQVWMATERGIAAWDGKKVRRVDTRRGLAENQVLDVAADQFDRVWARGPGSLTLISQ
jgi:ligand-binding sensor domain-containing protein